jgi:hypothetical protein
MIRFWRPGNGEELRAIRAEEGVWALAGSPTQPELTVSYSSTVSILDCRNAEEVHRFSSNAQSFTALANSADGRMLAVAVASPSASYTESISVYETASWKPAQSLKMSGTGRRTIASVTFARGSRFLAAGTEEGTVLLWDLSTGSLLPELRGNSGEILSVASSRDGELLATGNSDCTALVWKVPEADSINPPGKPVSPCESVINSLRMSAMTNGLPPGVWLWNNLYFFADGETGVGRKPPKGNCEALWHDLAAPDAEQGYAALWGLVLRPGEAVAYVGKQLRPVGPADPGRFREYISELTDDRFAIREEAFRRLKQSGDLAAPALQERLAQKPSPDERRRILELLRHLRTWSPEEMRYLRAIQVLEYTGTPKARTILERLAGGRPESRLTREAKLSLNRLNLSIENK